VSEGSAIAGFGIAGSGVAGVGGAAAASIVAYVEGLVGEMFCPVPDG
jgi:hypothetical protein